MVKTFETLPQMIVNVEGLPAVCHNRTCDFTYTENVGDLTSFTFAADTQLITITGTDLPTDIANIQQVNFALAPCVIAADFVLSGTSIQCTLSRNPTCGDWIPNIVTTTGTVQASAVA